MTAASLQLSGRKVLVVGLGRSGAAAANLCARLGARVTATDRQPTAALTATLARLPAGVTLELGGHRRASFLGADLLVLSPGVPPLPEVAAARAAGVEVTGELELASRLVEAPIVAITGTNGKSTTTTLCGEILAATGHPTFVGGNLGTPLAEAVGTPAVGAGGFAVVEVSSFQLETTRLFRPRVAVMLNVTPDHLDRYAGLADYAAAKARVFAAQGAGDFAVLNADDPVVAAMATPELRARGVEVLWFSTRRPLDRGPGGAREGSDGAGWLEGGVPCLRLPGGEVERYPDELPGLVGRHNLENALAATLAARLLGATAAEAATALVAFRPLAHRMTEVAEVGGVRYYDDSKGTNVGAVVAALDGFPRPVVLIAGGRDKGGSYRPLAEALRAVGRGVVLIGEAAERIAAALADPEVGLTLPVARAPSLEQAVRVARDLARPGDAVVLSPACSSFDMFRNYGERGDVFRAAVLALEARPSAPSAAGAGGRP